MIQKTSGLPRFKAIETEFKGILYRSRLEARWAVYMNYLGIKFQYEPEGFEMLDGLKYLPDFYFPEYNVYGEVKPEAPISDYDMLKMKEFGTQKELFLMYGLPESKATRVFAPWAPSELMVIPFAYIHKKKYGFFWHTGLEFNSNEEFICEDVLFGLGAWQARNYKFEQWKNN